MSKLKKRYFGFKASLCLTLLAVLGFTACDDDDIQPEYGVPVVRDVTTITNHEGNDSIVVYEFEIDQTK